MAEEIIKTNESEVDVNQDTNTEELGVDSNPSLANNKDEYGQSDLTYQELEEIPSDSIDEEDKPKTTDYLESSVNGDEPDFSMDLKGMDDYWEQDWVQQTWRQKYGDKAKEQFEKDYKEVLVRNQKQAAEKAENSVAESLIFGHSEDQLSRYNYAGGYGRNIGKGRTVAGSVYGQTVSVREANLESKNLLTDKGEFVKIEDDWKDIVDNDKYKSSDGRKIVALQYIPFSPEDNTEGGMKAIYEGDRPDGEIASKYAIYGMGYANIGLESDWKIPRAVGKALTNTAADLAGGVVGIMNSIGTLLDGDNEGAFLDWTEDQMTHFKSLKMSSADYDQEHMLTSANALDLTANIFSQLLLGGAVGKIVAGTAKILTAGAGSMDDVVKAANVFNKLRAAGATGKELEAAAKAIKLAKKLQVDKVAKAGNIVQKSAKGASIMTLSLMASNAVRDEMLNSGFSEDAAAGMFLAFLPAMYAANSISDKIINPESLGYVKKAIESIAKDESTLIGKMVASTPKAKWAQSKLLSNKIVQKVHEQIAKQNNKITTILAESDSSIGAEVLAASVTEATEEVTEQFIGDLMKTSANILSSITTPRGEEAPHMVGMFDEEYWRSAPVEYLMNAVGGAMGGTMARFTFGKQHSNALAFKKSDHDKLLRLVLKGENSQELKMYEESLEKARTDGSFGSDKHSWERDTDGNFKLLANMTAEERANTMSIAEANYRMRKLQLNHFKSIVGDYGGTYDQFVKSNPNIGQLLTDKSNVHMNIVNTYNELEELYKDVSNEKKDAASKMSMDSEVQGENATADKARQEAKSKKKTKDSDEPSTKTEEKVDSADNINQGQYTEQEKVFAGILHVSPEKARTIMKKEQELRDILNGKTSEREVIQTLINSDPDTFGVLGSSTEELFKHLGKDVLDTIIQGDTDNHVKMQQRHADNLKKRDELERSIKGTSTTNEDGEVSYKGGLNSIEDLEALGESITDGDLNFYVSHENMQVLKSKVNDIVSKNITDADINTLHSILGKKFDILSDEELREMSFELENELAATLPPFFDSELYEESIDQFIEDNQDKILQYAKSAYYRGLVNTGKSGLLNALAANVNYDTESFLNMVRSAWKMEDAIEMSVMGNPSATQRLELYYGDFSERGSIPLISEEEAKYEHLRGPMEIYRKLDRNRSDLSPTGAGTGINILQRKISPIPSGVEVGEETYYDNIDKLNKSVSSAGIFDGVEEAEEGLQSAKLRKAQIELMFRIGNPLSTTKLSDFLPKDGEELSPEDLKARQQEFLQYIAPTTNTLATLRNLNAQVLSPEEFNASIKDTKYSKLTKFISGWVFDPVKFVELTEKGYGRTTSETAEHEKMIGDLLNIAAFHEDLGSIIDRYQELIELGKESLDEVAVARKFKYAAIKYFGESANRIYNATETLNNDKVKSLAEDLIGLAAENDESRIEEAYKIYTELASEIYHGVTDVDKKTFIQKVLRGNITSSRDNDIIAMMLADIKTFHSHYGSILSGIKNNPNEDLIVPTIDQEVASFQAFAFMTKSSDNQLTALQKALPASHADTGIENVLWVPGAYGTGKTQIVFGMGARAAQMQFRAIDKQHAHNVTVCANNIDQINTLGRTAGKFNVTTQGGYTPDQLIELLNREDAHKELKDVSLIVFDEATYLDLYDKSVSKTESSLNNILRNIQRINKRRDPGQPPITFMAIGDSKQGGWRRNMPTLSGEIVSTDSVPSNISGMSNIFGTRPLIDNFRSYVREINTFANKLLTIANANMKSAMFNGAKVSRISSVHGTVTSGKLAGVEVVSGADFLYSDELAKDIKDKLDKDPDFKVLIVDENLNSIDDLPEKFRNIIDADKYGGKVTVLFQKDVNRIKVKNIKDAQGLEADYVLINTPVEEGGWLPPLDKLSEKAYRYDLLSMLVGRAKYYAKVRIDKSINIESEPTDTIKEIKSSLSEYMNEWSTLRMGMLDTANPDVTSDSEQTEETEPDLTPSNVDYRVGEEVSKVDAEGNFIETVTVVNIKEDGTIEFQNADGKIFTENIKEGSNLGARYARDKSNDRFVPLPDPINYEVGEQIAVYNMRFSRTNGKLVTNQATISRVYTNKDGDRIAIVESSDPMKPRTWEPINLDDMVRKDAQDNKSVKFTGAKFRRASTQLDPSFNNQSKNTREDSYKNYTVEEFGNIGSIDGRKVIVTKIDEGTETIEIKDADTGKVETIPQDQLGTTLLIDSIERTYEKSTIKPKQSTGNTLVDKAIVGTINEDTQSMDTDSWSELEKEMAAQLEHEVFEFEKIDSYIEELENEIDVFDLTKEDKANKVILINKLNAIKDKGQEDPELTPTQRAINEILSDDVETSGDVSVNEESKEYLSELESEGIGIGYSEVRTKKLPRLFNYDTDRHPSDFFVHNRVKFYYAAEMFGLENTVPQAELPALTLRAMGRSKDGTAATRDFTYSFVSYQYSFDSPVGQKDAITHAMVATTKEGKKFIVALIPTENLSREGEIQQGLKDRVDLFQSKVDAYQNKVSKLTTQDDWGNHDQLVEDEENHTITTQKAFRDKKSFKKIKGKFLPLYMETDITMDMRNSKIIKGATAGGLVMTSPGIKRFLEGHIDQVSLDGNIIKDIDLDVNKYELGEDPDYIKAMDAVFESLGEINEDTVNKYKNDKFSPFFNYKNGPVFEHNGAKIVITTIHNRKMPFYTTDGTEFTPFFGIDRDGNFIVDTDNKIVSNDPEMLRIKEVLESVGMDIDMKGTTTAEILTEEEVKRGENADAAFRGMFAAVLGYSVSDLDNTSTKWSQLKLASQKLMQTVPKSLRHQRITLDEMRMMLKDRSQILSVSNPLVLRKSINEDNDSALKAGVPFVFYSYNPNYDLSDPSVIKGLESVFADIIEKGDQSAMEEALAKTKNGVGMIMLDHQSYSITELLSRYKEMGGTIKNDFNRYVIPSGSEVNSRLMGFFTDIAVFMKNAERSSRDEKGNLMMFDKSQYSRIEELQKSLESRVLSDDKLAEFVDDVFMNTDRVDTATAQMFLSILDSMTKDNRMGHYITDGENLTPIDRLYPGLDPESSSRRLGEISLKLGEDSHKPLTNGLDELPMVFIPGRHAKDLGYEAHYEPKKFNLEAFFKMIESNRTPENSDTIDKALALFDELMHDFTNPGTLGLGIKIPPAVVGSSKTGLWYEFPKNSELEKEMTTNVKDIKMPSPIFDIKNLLEAINKQKIEGSDTIKDKINNYTENMNSTFGNIVQRYLDRIAKTEGGKVKYDKAVNAITRAFTKQMKSEAAKYKLQFDSIGDNSSIVTDTVKAHTDKFLSEVQKMRPVFEHEFVDIREGNIPKADSETISESNMMNPEFKKEFERLTNKLRYVVDGVVYEQTKKELETLINTVPGTAEYFKNYLKPIYAGMDPKKATLGSRASIDTVIQLMNDPVSEPLVLDDMEGESIENVIRSLEGMQDGAPIKPEHKTAILEAWNAGNQDVKDRLYPYLMSNIENPLDPVTLKFALYEAFVSTYPVQLDTVQSLQTLKESNEEMYDQLMNNKDVQDSLSEERADNLVQVVEDFKQDVQSVIDGQVTTDEKLALLGALDIVIEGLTSILPNKIITQMTENVNVARDSINNVRGQGSGINLIGLAQNTADYRGLVRTKGTGSNALSQEEVDNIVTKVQSEVGPQIKALYKSLMEGEESLESKEKSGLADEALLLGDSIFKHSNNNPEVAMLISQMITTVQQDPNCTN